MKLPDGVFERLRQPDLIAKDAWAIIRIDSEGNSGNNRWYQIRQRNFGDDIQPYMRGDWADFDRDYQLSRQRHYTLRGQRHESPTLYSGAEHTGSPGKNPVKLPNITVVPNFSTDRPAADSPRPYTVLGCTMGHYHPPAPRGPRVQEVYEFQSYGCLALGRRNGEIELWVAKDGDKVSVPSDCHMTLYNLGDHDHPLITLDFADPDRNPANKDTVRDYGPALLAYYDDFKVVFAVNRLYVTNPNHDAGVWLSQVPDQPRQRQVWVHRGGRLDLGRLLYEELTLNPEVIGELARLRIRIHKATPEAILEPLPSGPAPRLHFSRPLVDATIAGTDAYRFFLAGSEEQRPKARVRSLTETGTRATAPAPARGRSPLALNRSLVVVVEGVGDWVENAYRKLFMDKVSQGRKLTVFYADDTRWKGRPRWAEPGYTGANRLADWETYLDKADPDDFARYRLLRPDVVFVVTPDFTHCAVASQWVGKSPLVFVEKPFDSHVQSVEDLYRRLAPSRTTTVFGLDHYQFYALPIEGLKPIIDRHLGWALARVEFCLLEGRLIELDRVRSLQHGLTLDLLPHLAALLTYFGRVDTIDDIRVMDVRAYQPLEAADPADPSRRRPIGDEFRHETYSRVRFTFKDHPDSDYPVPCDALVGKGCSRDVKYLEVEGVNGNAARIDLTAEPKPNPRPDYPWDSAFLLLRPGQPLDAHLTVREVPDPYLPSRTLYVVEDPKAEDRLQPRLKRKRYWELLDDLFDGTEAAIGGTLSVGEGLEIVRALDRIWWALRKSEVASYRPGEFSPLDAFRQEREATR